MNIRNFFCLTNEFSQEASIQTALQQIPVLFQEDIILITSSRELVLCVRSVINIYYM